MTNAEAVAQLKILKQTYSQRAGGACLSMYSFHPEDNEAIDRAIEVLQEAEDAEQRRVTGRRF